MRTVQLQRDMNELKEVLQFWGLDVINLEELNDTTVQKRIEVFHFMRIVIHAVCNTWRGTNECVKLLHIYGPSVGVMSREIVFTCRVDRA